MCRPNIGLIVIHLPCVYVCKRRFAGTIHDGLLVTRSMPSIDPELQVMNKILGSIISRTRIRGRPIANNPSMACSRTKKIGQLVRCYSVCWTAGTEWLLNLRHPDCVNPLALLLVHGPLAAADLLDCDFRATKSHDHNECKQSTLQKDVLVKVYIIMSLWRR